MQLAFPNQAGVNHTFPVALMSRMLTPELCHASIIQEHRDCVQANNHTLSGRTRKVVVNKTEVMYVPLLETLQK